MKMSIEEQVQEQNEFKKYWNSKFDELILMDKDKPLTKIDLLRLGAYRQDIGSQELYIVKIPTKNDYPFIFLKKEEFWYKW